MAGLRRRKVSILWIATMLLSVNALGGAGNGSSGVRLTVLDKQTKRPVACDIYITNPSGESEHPAGVPLLHDHFISSGSANLELTPGKYSYQVEKGKEYFIASGSFYISRGKITDLEVNLERFANMTAAGWYAGDLHCHLPAAEMKLAMLAQNVHIGSVMWWWTPSTHQESKTPPTHPIVKFNYNYYLNLMAGEDERGPSLFMYFNLPVRLIPRNSTMDYPPEVKLLEEASRVPGVWIDSYPPVGWMLPVYLALESQGLLRIDSMEVASGNTQRYTTLPSYGFARHQDKNRYPHPWGAGVWPQDIYFHILNSGFRIAPSAGTTAGVHWSPLGYNRVYAYVGSDMTYKNWWCGLKAGRCFITNGPLLLVKANDQQPGYIFTGQEGKALNLNVKVTISRREPVPFLDVIKDGNVVRKVPLDSPKDYTLGTQTLDLGDVSFEHSGWFLIRAVTKTPDDLYRFAMTAPFYVEIGRSKRLISRHSAEFFLNWVKDAIQSIQSGIYPWDQYKEFVPSPLPVIPSEQREILHYYSVAEKFWANQATHANAR